MIDNAKLTSILLAARAQAWFEAFVVVESLPPFNPQWIDGFVLPPKPGMFVYTRLGRGPLQHRIGNSAFMYFDNGEVEYPIFNHPSTGPRGAGLNGGKTDQLMIVDERVAIFSVEVIVAVPAARELFDKAFEGTPDDAAANPVLNSAKSALDTIAGSFALYQYPLVWKHLAERSTYTFVDIEGPKATRSFGPQQMDNFIPFKLEASCKVTNGQLSDNLIAEIGTVLEKAEKMPLIFLKDSMWHSDIRTRFLLQFWIIEYFAERCGKSGGVSYELRGFVKKLEDLVAAHMPENLELFRSQKGELTRTALAQKVKACFEHFRIKYDDTLFKKAKRVRDALSHGSSYKNADLIAMEHYTREIARYLLQRDLEFKGIFLDKSFKDRHELPMIVPMFAHSTEEEKTAKFEFP
ncbi:MAG: hypothetical protein JXA73_11990 [Acidobacteria bacterium]|nr:hypothetical protein [Acidobacteriota bacterium]